MNNSLEKKVEQLEKELQELKAALHPKKYDIRAAAEFTGLAEKTIRNRISKGYKGKRTFPQPSRAGGKLLWTWEELANHREGQE